MLSFFNLLLHTGPQVRQQAQGLVLGSLHDFALARPLVVDSTQVQNAMHHHTVELLLIGLAQLLGIGTYGVDTDKEVAAYFVTSRIVKGDNVRIVVMLQVLPVDFQDFLVVTKT